MNNFQIQAFVRQLIAEAKAKKDEPKKDIKKPIKKEAKEEKSSGKLVDLKKELKEKQEELEKINRFIKDLSGITTSRSNYSDIEIIGDAIDDLDADIKSLEEEKKKLEDDIASLKEKTSSEINKIKEMMGLVPETKGKKKIMDEENKPIKPIKPILVTPDNEVKADKDTPMTTEAKKMTAAQKSKKEDIVKGMKKSGSFGKSKEEKSKMYATATKLATKKK